MKLKIHSKGSLSCSQKDVKWLINIKLEIVVLIGLMNCVSMINLSGSTVFGYITRTFPRNVFEWVWVVSGYNVRLTVLLKVPAVSNAMINGSGVRYVPVR